jgi:hypothetical protein
MNAFIYPLQVALYRGGPPTGGNDLTQVTLDDLLMECLHEFKAVLSGPEHLRNARWLVSSRNTLRLAFTDASGKPTKDHHASGWALCIGPHVIAGDFASAVSSTPGLSPEDMTWREMWPYVWFVEHYSHLLQGLIIIGIIDNQAAAFEINKQATRCPARRMLLWRLARAMRRYNFELFVDWRHRKFLVFPDRFTHV